MLAHRFRKRVLLEARCASWRLRHRIAGGRVEPRPPPAPLPPLVVVLVYRRRNEGVVAELLGPLRGRDGVDVRLWALDEVAPELAPWTVGSGPAPKFELVTRLLDHEPLPESSYVAVCDDDLLFARGGWEQLLDHVVTGGFDLAQPAHDQPRNFSHWLTVSAAGSVARRTRFVEIGPLFVVSPSFAETLREGMRSARMGWGLEALWSRHAAAGRVLGVVDAVTIDHLAYPGTEYDNADAEAELSACMAEAGVTRMSSFRVVDARWRQGEPSPPW